MVIELHVVQFWSEIILVISNLTRTACSFDFENHAYDFSPNCTPLCSTTIINHKKTDNIMVKTRIIFLLPYSDQL